MRPIASTIWCLYNSLSKPREKWKIWQKELNALKEGITSTQVACKKNGRDPLRVKKLIEESVSLKEQVNELKNFLKKFFWGFIYLNMILRTYYRATKSGLFVQGVMLFNV